MPAHDEPFSGPEPTSPVWVILNPKAGQYARARREIGVDAVRYILNNCDYTYDRNSGGWSQVAIS